VRQKCWKVLSISKKVQNKFWKNSVQKEAQARKKCFMGHIVKDNL